MKQDKLLEKSISEINWIMSLDKKREKKVKSKQRGEYKVVFKGHLLPGFDKEQVVINIARLTKLPLEKIEKKFFSGKVVIIRRAEDEAYAQKLQQLFTRAGLEVFILKDLTRQIEQNIKLPPGKSTNLKKFISRNIRLIIAAVLCAVLIVVGVELWNKYNINVEAPDEIIDIESSLANKPLLFLAHINLQRLLSRRNYFVNDSDALPGTQSTFYRQLKNAGIEPEKSIRQILTSAYIEDQQLISQTILLGHFTVDSVKRFFVDNYHGEVLPDADFIRLRISQIDDSSCEKGNFMELSIEPERILISTYGHLNELHQLLSLSPGKVTDLSNWKQYQHDKLVSLAFFNAKSFKPEILYPKKNKSGQGMLSTSGLTRIMAENLINANESMDSLFASVGLQLLPPSGLFDVTLNSKNQVWLKQTRSDLLKQLKEMKNNSSGLLNLQLLLSKIALQQNVQPDLRENSDGEMGQLSMTIELDSGFRQSIEASLSELLEMFFSLEPSAFGIESSTVGIESSAFGIESSTVGIESSTFGIDGSSIDQSNVQEKLDTAPLKYWPQYKPAELKPFNEALDKFFKPAWIEGPFAVAIDELLLESHQDGDQVILQLRGKAQNIDNLGRQQATLTVTGVHDQQGKNLLDKMKCSQSAFSDDEFFTSLGGLRTAYHGDKEISYNELEVRQKVKLKTGIKFSQVKSLKGVIELNLATQTQSRQFARTAQNKILTEYDSRILFKPAAADTLSYVISGNEKKVLTVRALNNKKQYLSSISRSSIANLFGRGHLVTETYQGEIAFIEVVYAVQQVKINYPFAISKFPPYPLEDQWKFEPEMIKLSSVANWVKNYQDLEPLSLTQKRNWHGEMQASWHDGALNLALFALKTSKNRGTTGQLMIKTPLIDELRHNLSALEVYFRYPQVTENGDVGRSYYYPLKAKGYYMNGEFITDKDKPYMDGQLAFTLPYKNEQAPLTEINGDIIIHLPVSKHGSTYTDMSIGALWEDEGVRAKIVRLGNEIMEFEVLSNRDRLLQITLIDSKNQRISTTDIHYGLDTQGRGGNIIVNYHGVPVKAILTVSEGQQTKRYPFKLQLE